MWKDDMTRKLVTLAIGSGCLIGASVASTALAANLDVRTGLWEMTSVGEATGMPPVPPEVLAKMTPEQRAKMQEAMGQASKPTVNRVCVSEKTLQKGFNFQQPKEANCKRDVLKDSSSQIDVHMECTGDTKMNGTFHLEALNRQTLHGNFNLVMNRDTNTMTMKRTMDGKWLGSDCGNVKPEEE